MGKLQTNSIFDLYSVFVIIVIFLHFIVVFQNVSALYKCSICFSRKNPNKLAKNQAKSTTSKLETTYSSRIVQILHAQASLTPRHVFRREKENKAGCVSMELHLTLPTQPRPVSIYTYTQAFMHQTSQLDGSANEPMLLGS